MNKLIKKGIYYNILYIFLYKFIYNNQNDKKIKILKSNNIIKNN